MRLLMLSGDEFVARRQQNVFYHMLREYSKHWKSIDIITPGGESTESFVIHDNVTIHPSTTRHYSHTRYIVKKGTELFAGKHFDLMTVHDYPPFHIGIGGWWLGRKTGLPYVLEYHHIVGYPKAPNLKEHLSRELTKIYLRCMWKFSRGIRVVNDVEVPGFLKQLGIPEQHLIKTSSLYIDFDVFMPKHLSKTGKKVLFTGRLVRNKGLSCLIHAFRLVLRECPDAELIICGPGPLKQDMQALSRKLGLDRAVSFVEMKSHVEVADLLNQCDIFVSPSYNEGGPRSAVEAMACGLSVLTTNIGKMKEIIRDGENGLFISWQPQDIADKIVLLLHDTELREKIARQGHQAVLQFEYTRMIQQYAAGYHTLIRDFSHALNR